MGGGETVTVHLYGCFRMLLPDGTDISPAGAKSRGLLALLLTSPGYRRSRVWLQDKLWSDRGREQGSASLRQALVEIRRALGDHVNLFATDRWSVGIEASAIRLAPAAAGEDFLEGIDIRDPEFEDWLTVERSARTVEPVVARPPLVIQQVPENLMVLLLASSERGSALRIVEDFFVDCAARTLREILSVDIRVTEPQRCPSSTVRVAVQGFHLGDSRIGLRVGAEHNESHALLWSGMQIAEMRGAIPIEDMEFLKLGNQLVDAIAEAFSAPSVIVSDEAHARLMGWLAVRKIFAMSVPQLVEAEGLLTGCFERDRRGLYQAWRAQLRAIQMVERHGGCDAALQEEGIALCREAVQLEPNNSMVLATVANAHLILARDFEASNEFSRRSVELNQANPMAWWARSAATLYNDQPEQAYAFAHKGRYLAATSPHRFWWDLQCSLSAAVTRRTDEAIRTLETVRAMSPEFRPPLRYLTALYAGTGRESEASATAIRLGRLEPDFSLDRMARDDAYPVSLMRRNGLLPAEVLRALG